MPEEPKFEPGKWAKWKGVNRTGITPDPHALAMMQQHMLQQVGDHLAEVLRDNQSVSDWSASEQAPRVQDLSRNGPSDGPRGWPDDGAMAGDSRDGVKYAWQASQRVVLGVCDEPRQRTWF